MSKNLLPIAKEGFSYLLYTFFAFIVFEILDLDILSFLSVVLFVYLVYMFRNPEREMINYEKGSVVSVADGNVLNIVELEDSKHFAYRVDIETTCRDISFLRAPFNATCKDVEVLRGTRVSKNSKLFGSLNENGTIIFEDENGNKVKVKHTLTNSFDELHVDVVKTVLQGQRYGFMLKGVTSIYLPSNFRLNVSVGSQTISSKTLIGYFL